MKIDTEKLVKGAGLLAALFPDEQDRPCVRTLANWRSRRIVPYFKIGSSVFYDIEKVREALERKNLIKAL